MKILSTSLFGLGLLAICLPGSAHHSRANFLLEETITFDAEITGYGWKNPHVFLEARATDSGEIWLIEAHSLTGLKRMGWDSETFVPGDKVVITGNPDRDPERNFVLLDYIVDEQGQTLYSFRRPEDRGETAAPDENISPSTDFSGTWTRVSSLRQALVGGFLPPDDWPLTEVGQDMVDGFSLHDNPEYDCISPGVPRIMLYPYLIRWTKLDDRITIEKEHTEFTRTIFLNIEDHPAALDPNPLGHSIGRIEDDGTLVVDTVGISAARWGLARGLNSSDQLHVAERYSLTDGGMGMDIAYTMTDPVYLAEPVTVEGRYRKVPDSPLTPYVCDPTAARQHLAAEN